MCHRVLIDCLSWNQLRRIIGIVLVCSLASGTVFIPGVWAATFYVDDDLGDDGRTATEAQSPATPWKTISRAIGEGSLAPGDTITVEAGTYDAALGESFPLTLVNGVAIVGAGSTTTTIRGPGASVLFLNSDTPLVSDTTLSGFTLTHDAADPANVGMSFVLASADMAPYLTLNRFLGVEYKGEGVKITDSGTDARSFTGLIYNNTIRGWYYGIDTTVTLSGEMAEFSPTIHMNILADNVYSVYQLIYEAFEGIVSPIITDSRFHGPGNAITMDFYNTSGHGGTMAPLISGNSLITLTSDGMYLNVYTVLLSQSTEIASYSPTILNNAIDAPFGNGVDINIYAPQTGILDVDLTIAGNTITDPYGDGVNLSLTNFTTGSSASLDMDVTISNNTISEADTGVEFNFNSAVSSFQGSVDLTTAGNAIADAGDSGIIVNFSGFDDATIGLATTIQGNTISHSGTNGVEIHVSSQSMFTASHADILDNVVDGSGNQGIYHGFKDFPSSSSYVKVSCNRVTNSVSDGVYLYGDSAAPNPDFGNGDLSSPGLNSFVANGGYDFFNNDDGMVWAQYSYWGTQDTATIDANIWDNGDNPSLGVVDYSGYLAQYPTVSATATLVDALQVDLPPTGPSKGDTIHYTATLTGSGECGCASALFTAPIPTNSTFVDGSLITSRGTLISLTSTIKFPDLIVGLGALEAAEAVSITWEVIAGTGDTIVSQATLSCYQLGAVLTDDPDVLGDTDPTSTTLSMSLFSDDFETSDTSLWTSTVG